MIEPVRYRGIFYKYFFNFFPSYRATGARVIRISPDFLEVDIKLPLNRKTKNYYGTTFGGSMYAAIDPVYAMMVYHALDKEFVVWDKAASIEYKKPGRTTLYASFRLNQCLLDEIRNTLKTEHSMKYTLQVDLVDHREEVHASFDKTIYIGRKK